MTRAVFWDIDGTLLVTGRAGLIAWERALAEVAGGTAFPAIRPDGLTDHQIAHWLLQEEERREQPTSGTGNPSTSLEAGREPAADDVSRLVARYEAELVDALPLRQGRVLANVQPVLDWLAGGGSDVLSWLVTGNTRAGGAAKLRHYALADYFRNSSADALLAGSFSERVEPRANIVRRALQLAQAQVPGLAAAEALVVGDTPHDIEGAHAIGVPVLAVATNTHSFEELASHRPWCTLRELPDVGSFERMLASGTG